ncbi:ribonuclease H-like domain-containing protein [Tanacetum coccineum]
MHANKSFNRNFANYRFYHALMEALIEDENIMDKGVVDTTKDHKRKHDDDEDDDDEDLQLDQTMFDAKATCISKLWHRSLGHINFKNLNKLVKGNLVRGLPSKINPPNVKGVGYRWMFDIDYLTDSMNYIPVYLENQASPHVGDSEVTNSASTSQTPKSIASEEKDEEVELIVVPSAVKIPEEKKMNQGHLPQIQRKRRP